MTDTTDMVPIGETARAIVSRPDREPLQDLDIGPEKSASRAATTSRSPSTTRTGCVGPSVSFVGVTGLIEQKSFAHFYQS